MKKSIPHRNLIPRNNLAASLVALLVILPLKLPAREISAHNPDLPRHPLTLQDCIAIALGESPKLEATRFDLLAAGEEIRAAQASLWPNLKGSATGEAFSDSMMHRQSRLRERKGMPSPGRLILLARRSSIGSPKSSSTPFQRRTACSPSNAE